MTGIKITPEQALKDAAAAGLVPLEPYPGAVRHPWAVECTGDTGPHGFRVTLKDIRGGSPQCAQCELDQRTAEAFKDMLAAGLEPLEDFPGNARAPWLAKCLRCGHECTPRLDGVRRGVGCPACARNIQISEPEALRRLAAAERYPVEPYPGAASRPWRTACLRCGHQVRNTLSAYHAHPGRCTSCARPRISETEALRTIEDAGLRPLEPYPGKAAKRWKLECRTCGWEMSPTLSSVRCGTGCKRCNHNGNPPLTNEQALALIKPFPAIIPLEPYPGSGHAGWLVRCRDCGLERRRSLVNMRTGRRCRACVGLKKVTAEEAVAEMTAAGFTPLEPYPGFANSSWNVKCRDGHWSMPSVTSVRRGQRCAHCEGVQAGLFDRGFPSCVYLLHSDALKAVKIGVHNLGSIRISEHEANGWQVVMIWDCDTGAQAWTVERTILRRWSQDGLPQAVRPEDMPQGGATETVPAALVDLEETVRVVGQLVAEQHDREQPQEPVSVANAASLRDDG